jgi:Uma2 family endonuclease
MARLPDLADRTVNRSMPARLRARIQLHARLAGGTQEIAMVNPAFAAPFSAAEYLRWEAEQPGKHEYVAGEVFAMGGASRRHVTVSGNLFAALSQALDGTPCRAYMADMKVEAAKDTAYFYPDVLVTCDPADHKADLAMSAPTLVAEVLSPSTAAYDRGDKFAAYRGIPSLREYVLIDSDQKKVELYRRGEDGLWVLRDIAPDTPLELTSVGVMVNWDRLFRNVD